MGKLTKAKGIIDNDKDFFFKKKSMTMIRKKRQKLCSDAEAESGADRYVRLFNAPECRLFFLKVMYHLPYDERERICEAAMRDNITNHKRYFTYSARRALKRIGY